MSRPIFIVVNKHRVRLNQRRPRRGREPVFRLSRGKYGAPWYEFGVELPAGARLVSDPDNPMPCGASVWIEAPGVVACRDLHAIEEAAA